MKKLLFIALLAGCQTSPYNLMDSIGVANIGLAGLANTALSACGNTEPGGPCVEGALIKRSDVDTIKRQLESAGVLLDAATVDGNPATAMAGLQSAQKVLIAVEKILRERGVQ